MIPPRRALAALVLAGGLLAGPADGSWSASARASADVASALTRARSGLWAQIAVLPLDADLTVGQWAARDVKADLGLRRWVRSLPPLRAARVYGDGSCDVDLRLTPADLLRRLRELNDALPVGRRVSPQALDAAATDWPVLWATGSAAAEGGRDGPPGWEDVTAEGVELARRSAAAAAVAEMLDRTSGLKLTTARALRDFVESSAAVRGEVRRFLEERAEIRTDLAPEQVAHAEGAVDLDALATGLGEIARRQEQSEFRADDFRGMVLLGGNRGPRGSGLSVAPEAERAHWPPEAQMLAAPQWSGRALRAEGVAGDGCFPGIGGVQRFNVALARALCELRERLNELPVGESMTMGQVLGYDESSGGDIGLLLAGARVVGTSRGLDGQAEVRLELPLLRAWLILRDLAGRRDAVAADETGGNGP